MSKQLNQIIKISGEIQFWILVMSDATDDRIIKGGEKVLDGMAWLWDPYWWVAMHVLDS